MTATLKFATRELAETFCKAWSRYSLRGHSLGSGLTDVSVKVHDVSESDERWINEWVKCQH